MKHELLTQSSHVIKSRSKETNYSTLLQKIHNNGNVACTLYLLSNQCICRPQRRSRSKPCEIPVSFSVWTVRGRAECCQVCSYRMWCWPRTKLWSITGRLLYDKVKINQLHHWHAFSRLSLRMCQLARQVRAYLSFCSMKWPQLDGMLVIIIIIIIIFI